MKALDENRLIEMFGTGTAAIVSVIGGIHYNQQMHDIPVPEFSLSKRLLHSITDIFYGRVNHPWAYEIETWREGVKDKYHVQDVKMFEAP